jgi:1-deoxyxylulose-5-phosphate synthase
MQYVDFAPLNRQMSRLVLGSMVCSTDKLEESFELLDAWAEFGGNVIDTAHVYGGGKSERAIGRWLQSRHCRHDMMIITKGAHHNMDRPRVTPEDITSDLRDSLARLQTDFIDLYLLHRDDPAVAVGPIVESLNDHLRAGRIHAFGGSNWSPQRLQEANCYAADHGLQGFSASSPHLSLAAPNGEVWPGCLDARSPEAAAWYQRTQMPLFAWSSQARGFFTGAFTPGNTSDEFMTRVYFSRGNWQRLERAQALGERKGASAVQVALAWVLHQPLAVFPLVGPAKVEELESCVAALDLELTAEEVAWLDGGDPA